VRRSSSVGVRVRARRKRFFRDYWERPYRWAGEVHDYGGFTAEASEYASSLLSSLEGLRLLELGAGQGIDASLFSRQGAQVVAADLAETPLRSLSRAQPRQGSIWPVCMLAEELACRDASFDRLFGRTVLLHVSRPVVWAELDRVLKGGARAIFIEPLRDNPFLLIYRLAWGKGRLARPRYLSLGEIIGLGTRFRRVEHREFYVVSVLALGLRPILARVRLYGPVVRLLKRVDTLLLAAVPWTHHFAWISVFAVEK
jgi:SAM-dependent methyltransferase